MIEHIVSVNNGLFLLMVTSPLALNVGDIVQTNYGYHVYIASILGLDAVDGMVHCVGFSDSLLHYELEHNISAN